jgi:hypothetical protein
MESFTIRRFVAVNENRSDEREERIGKWSGIAANLHALSLIENSLAV